MGMRTAAAETKQRFTHEYTWSADEKENPVLFQSKSSGEEGEVETEPDPWQEQIDLFCGKIKTCDTEPFSWEIPLHLSDYETQEEFDAELDRVYYHILEEGRKKLITPIADASASASARSRATRKS